MKFRSRGCPLCGSQDESQVVTEQRFDEAALVDQSFSSRKVPDRMHLRMVLCRACDLVYASRAPLPDWLEGRYRAASFAADRESRFAARTYAELLVPVFARLPDRAGALDIGTGDGTFLAELLENGFEGVHGTEPSAAPVARAEPRVSGLIREGFFRAEDFGDGSVSLVTCFQTLEHVESPSELAAAAHRILKRGGAFVAVSHDFRSLSARLLGSRSPIFDIEHLQLFSPVSMAALYRRAGFGDVTVAPLSNRYPLGYWLRLFPLPDRWKATMLRALDGIGLGEIAISLRAGNIVTVGYKGAA